MLSVGEFIATLDWFSDTSLLLIFDFVDVCLDSGFVMLSPESREVSTNFGFFFKNCRKSLYYIPYKNITFYNNIIIPSVVNKTTVYFHDADSYYQL